MSEQTLEITFASVDGELLPASTTGTRYTFLLDPPSVDAVTGQAIEETYVSREIGAGGAAPVLHLWRNKRGIDDSVWHVVSVTPDGRVTKRTVYIGDAAVMPGPLTVGRLIALGRELEPSEMETLANFLAALEATSTAAASAQAAALQAYAAAALAFAQAGTVGNVNTPADLPSGPAVGTLYGVYKDNSSTGGNTPLTGGPSVDGEAVWEKKTAGVGGEAGWGRKGWVVGRRALYGGPRGPLEVNTQARYANDMMNRIVNGRGELGVSGWTVLDSPTTFESAFDENGQYLHFQHTAGVAGTFPKFFRDIPAWLAPTAPYYVSVDCLFSGAAPKLKVSEIKGGAETVHSDLALESGKVNVRGPFASGTAGANGVLRVMVYYASNETGDARLRIANHHAEPGQFLDTGASLTELYGQHLALATTQSTFAATKGAASGLAPLGSDSRVPSANATAGTVLTAGTGTTLIPDLVADPRRSGFGAGSLGDDYSSATHNLTWLAPNGAPEVVSSNGDVANALVLDQTTVTDRHGFRPWAPGASMTVRCLVGTGGTAGSFGNFGLVLSNEDKSSRVMIQLTQNGTGVRDLQFYQYASGSYGTALGSNALGGAFSALWLRLTRDGSNLLVPSFSLDGENWITFYSAGLTWATTIAHVGYRLSGNKVRAIVKALRGEG